MKSMYITSKRVFPKVCLGHLRDQKRFDRLQSVLVLWEHDADDEPIESFRLRAHRHEYSTAYKMLVDAVEYVEALSAYRASKARYDARMKEIFEAEEAA